MRMYKLTSFALELNVAIASGRYQDITDEEVQRHIEDETIFQFLSKRLDIAGPLSILTPVDRLELLIEWGRVREYVKAFGYDTGRHGLCLLVAYLITGMAMRAELPNYRLTPEMC